MRLCSPPNDSPGAGRASSNHRLPLIPHHDRGGGPLWPAPACRQRGPSDLFGHLWSGRACRDRHCFHMGPAISAPFSNQGPGAGVIHHFVPERERSVFIGFLPCRPLISVCGALASSLPFRVRLAIDATLPRLGKAPSQARDSTIDCWNFSDTGTARELRLPVTLPSQGNGLLRYAVHA